MKIEKRMIALCICTLLIGLATVLPLTYFTHNTVSAQTNDPEFDISIDYLYFSANAVADGYQRVIGVGFMPLIDFNAFNPQTVAKIEYYDFVYYTDDQELGRSSHFIGANNTYIDTDEYMSGFHDLVTFSRAAWFENNFERSCSGYWSSLPIAGDGRMAMSQGGADAPIAMGGPNYLGYAFIDECDNNGPLDEIYNAILMAIENKQTIYLDVIRVGSTTFDDKGDIVVAYTNDTIIHLELTKNGDAYTFGNLDVIENVIPEIEQVLSTPNRHKNNIV
ncbi:MAG: hypothetical protein LBH74_05535 [Nitrososphaerota archaeon]|jgi:hypothetical protein|nr:hypothetical protein [Nitrososphaerota archaeon]